MEFNRLDIVSLINDSPITRLSERFNTKLLDKIKDNFTDNQQQLFVSSFYTYLNYNTYDFIIDLENVWRWCGFSRKDPAKRLLEKFFTKDIDYKVLLHQSVEQISDPTIPSSSRTNYFATETSVANFAPEVAGAKDNRGGYNKEQILMTINTFKKFCLKAETKKADEIHDYYIKLEELMQQTLQEELEEKEQEIRNQQTLIEEKEKELEEKDKEIEQLENFRDKTYEEVEKSQHVYVIKTDGGIKVGKTKDAVNKRIKGMQTANVGDIQILTDFKTHNADLLEKCVHYVLDRYRCNSNREFFSCKKEYIIQTVFTIGTTLNTLKSSFQTISQDDLKEKLFSNLDIEYNQETPESEDPLPEYEDEVRDFYLWLDRKCRFKKNSTLTLKSICTEFLNKQSISPRISNIYRLMIEKYIRDKYPHIPNLYKDSSYNGERYKGWIHLELI